MIFDTDWKPVRGNGVPLYRQITDYIRSKITQGEWTVGSRIPTERALAKSFGVNRSTVVSAFAELVADGLLQGNSGRGTVVVNNTWSLMASATPPDWERYMNAGIHEPNLPTIQEINHAEFIPGIIRLGTGEPSPEFFPQEMMREVLRTIPDHMTDLGYAEPKGLYELRVQISRYVQQHGIEASPSSILIVSGALQALQLISMGLLLRGSAVLTENPSYLQSLHVFQSAGMELASLPLDDEGVRLDPIRHYTEAGRGSILYTIPSFQNPTGRVMSERRREMLYELCLQRQLPIIEDDVYRDLWLDAEAPPPLKSRDHSGTVLYLGSMSKTLSAGLRIGWIIGPEAVIHRLADLKMQMDYGASSLSQWAVTAWLEGGFYAKHLEQVRASLRVRRDHMLRLLAAHLSDVTSWEAPTGGFYIWLRITIDFSMKAFFDKALAQGVLLNPGHLYDRADSQHIRLSYAYASMDQMETGIRILANILNRKNE
ncbi:aminotransferase class I/II-fold pyridoxal phosphate-dependent enzyme [Paenibacillus terrigena]|uniref:aminotransferase class I/II-fold pyridoxal phosphate-dependent enzyme n=1 Tax=Paenibacillus terrigena TaxID=369333 RepID=UPI00036B35D4